MSVLKEFKQFAVKGNVMDLAVGVIIGAAFGKIVASLVTDLLMPPISLLLGDVNFVNRYVVLRGNLPPGTTLAEAKAAGATVWAYGAFLNTLVEFLIVAWAVFMLVKQLNRLRVKQEAAPAPTPTTRTCPECLTEIPKAATRCKACTATVPAV